MELNNWFEDFSSREKFSEHDKNRINVKSLFDKNPF